MFVAVAFVVAAALASVLFVVLRMRCPTLSTAALPVYPGASDIIDVPLPEYPDTRSVAHLVVSGKLDDVTEYYQRAMLDNGWEYQGQRGVWHFYQHARSGCPEALFSAIFVSPALEGIAMHAFISSKPLPF